MAAIYKFPVLVIEDHGGLFTACLLERHDDTSAVGQNVNEALLHLKEYLRWKYRGRDWLTESDFLEPAVRYIKFQVRPEYREEEDRVYPCQETVSLRVPCVHGKEGSGMFVCLLPTLDVRFNYYEKGALNNLAVHFAKEELRSLTPQGLSKHLPPRAVSLHEIVIILKGSSKKNEESHRYQQEDFKHLGVVAEPLSGSGQRGKPARAWGRDAEVEDLFQRLHSGRVNIILSGEPGVGKTTILAEAARKLERISRENGEDVYPHRLWMTSAQRIIAGMRYLGQWEERCEKIIEELSMIDGILCVENLLDLVKTGGSEPQDSVAAFFMLYMKRGEISIIAEATPAEIDACRRLLPGLVDLFQVINIGVLLEKEAKSLLDQIVRSLSRNLHIKSEEGISGMIHRLFARFMPYSPFPGKAAAFLPDLFDKLTQEKKDFLEGRFVMEHFARKTGLSELFLRDEITLRSEEVLAEFRKKIIGQDAACEAATKLVMTFKAGMNDPLRPLGVLLFCGPTGVGKTALARAITDYFFGHGEETGRLIRLDMSEYSGPGSADGIIADPDGQPGTLIKKIRLQPFSVVLLDEIEKASPEVFDVFLNMFDEGRLVDSYGRVTTFRSAIIMTSNLGAKQQDSIGFEEKPISYDAEVQSFFRPEFFNRIDMVVTFNPLSKETILAITEKELREISEREGLSANKIRLSWTRQLTEYLAYQGFDHKYGARQLQRTIERLLVTPLARYLVTHPGLKNVTIKADMNRDSKVIFCTDSGVTKNGVG